MNRWGPTARIAGGTLPGKLGAKYQDSFSHTARTAGGTSPESTQVFVGRARLVGVKVYFSNTRLYVFFLLSNLFTAFFYFSVLLI